MTYPEQYLQGIELFNAGKFWHAHESWEEAWLAAEDEQLKLFYKGIIQTAAALVHWQKGNPKGLHLNWAKARVKLEQLPPEMMGLGIRKLIVYMDYFNSVDGNGPEPPHFILTR
jgi:predicted metal-dependent hydrolase